MRLRSHPNFEVILKELTFWRVESSTSRVHMGHRELLYVEQCREEMGLLDGQFSAIKLDGRDRAAKGSKGKLLLNLKVCGASYDSGSQDLWGLTLDASFQVK